MARTTIMSVACTLSLAGCALADEAGAYASPPSFEDTGVVDSGSSLSPPPSWPGDHLYERWAGELPSVSDWQCIWEDHGVEIDVVDGSGVSCTECEWDDTWLMVEVDNICPTQVTIPLDDGCLPFVAKLRSDFHEANLVRLDDCSGSGLTEVTLAPGAAYSESRVIHVDPSMRVDGAHDATVVNQRETIFKVAFELVSE